MKWLFVVSFWLLAVYGNATSQPKVRLGNELFIERSLDVLKGKRVGLVVNPTARLSSGEFLVDALIAKGVQIVALFGPEHGVRGEAAAGEKVSDSNDLKTGIRVFSLYGKTNKPTPEMMSNVDVLVYDIQDVGVRFYTYISTMGLCMEAAAEIGIPFIVLDRPNPLGGLKVDGPIMEDSLRSFVGMYPIPVVYGLTCGELAMMANENGWLKGKAKCNLTVVKTEGWEREMLWNETGLDWIAPSPNMRSSEAALAYPATCFFEATNISEGRGSPKPFEFLGAPFIESRVLINALHRLKMPGVKWDSTSFTPTSSKHAGESCNGISISIIDWKKFQPIATGLLFIQKVKRLFPETTIRESGLARLLGSRKGSEYVSNGLNLRKCISTWNESALQFQQRSKRYWLY